MSQEAVDVVLASFEAWQQGLDAYLATVDPEVDWRAIEGALDDVGPIIGVDALRAYVQDWLDHFDNFEIELEEMIDAGDQVVVAQRVSGTAKGSGVPTELRYAVVYTIKNGRIAKGREYWTREEALKTVGRD
jgi:ketosteroid isomerase-like protein